MSKVKLYEYGTDSGKRMLIAYNGGKYMYIATREEEEIKKIRLECENVPFSQLKHIRTKYRVHKKARRSRR